MLMLLFLALPKLPQNSVWQSLKPEAERLGKLAEWEKEFSQVSHPKAFIYGPRRQLKRTTSLTSAQFANGEEDFNSDDVGGLDAMHDQFNVNAPPGVNGTEMGPDGYPLLGDYEFGGFSRRLRGCGGMFRCR
jgi:peroxin-5